MGLSQEQFVDLLQRADTADAEGEQLRAKELLPLVYTELRQLARARLAALPPGHTLQPTALVHEAYLRLAGKELAWDGTRHFLFAAARAMHDILVEHARQKASLKRGGDRGRLDLDRLAIADEAPPEEIVALSQAMQEFEQLHPRAHQLVMLRFFAGCTSEQAATTMQVSPSTAAREWRYARAWLHERLSIAPESP